jgi:hypothetical protein
LLTVSTVAAEKIAKPAKDLASYIAIFDSDVVDKLDKDIFRPLSDSVRLEIVKSGNLT